MFKKLTIAFAASAAALLADRSEADIVYLRLAIAGKRLVAADGLDGPTGDASVRITVS